MTWTDVGESITDWKQEFVGLRWTCLVIKQQPPTQMLKKGYLGQNHFWGFLKWLFKLRLFCYHTKFNSTTDLHCITWKPYTKRKQGTTLEMTINSTVKSLNVRFKSVEGFLFSKAKIQLLKMKDKKWQMKR